GFFFQAEDGIRDGHVTGVQTCALPISALELGTDAAFARELATRLLDGVVPERVHDLGSVEQATLLRKREAVLHVPVGEDLRQSRSEERRVGKEDRTWWARDEWRTHRIT